MAHLLASASSSSRALFTPLLVSRRYLSATCTRQSGHNKWSKIKHGKAVQDAMKSALYKRVATEIAIAARTGGSPDPTLNVSLQLVISKAKKLGVPKDNIEAALRRVSGATGTKDAVQSTTYEVMGPGGVPFVLECMTDNPTRTFMRLREGLNKFGGRMANVAYLFEEKAIFRIDPREGQTFDAVFDLAVEGGAEDVVELEDGEIEVKAPPHLFHALNTLLAPRTNLQSSEIAQLPITPSEEQEPVTPELEDQLEKFESWLEENADCVRAWRGR